MSKFIGQKVIVRGGKPGVYFGTLIKVSGNSEAKEVELKDARNINYWEGAASTVQIAMEGIKNAETNRTRLTMVIPNIELFGISEIFPCTEISISNLENISEWKK